MTHFEPRCPGYRHVWNETLQQCEPIGPPTPLELLVLLGLVGGFLLFIYLLWR